MPRWATRAGRWSTSTGPSALILKTTPSTTTEAWLAGNCASSTKPSSTLTLTLRYVWNRLAILLLRPEALPG